jgi:EcsC family protein
MAATPLSDEDLAFLGAAAEYLERPSFLMYLTNLLGKPSEMLLTSLPAPARNLVTQATQKALHQSLQWAIRSLSSPAKGSSFSLEALSDGHRHAAVAAMTGAVGGFFGLAGTAVEIPLTTTVMLRSIARIAADAGASLDDPATRLECLTVFSLGSQPLEDMESAYLTTRIGLAVALNKAAQFVGRSTAQQLADSLARGTAPVLVRLVNMIAARFEVVVSEKLAAQSLPVAGAALGAALNAAFAQHFNHVARYHFGILRLERLHGQDLVQAAYRERVTALSKPAAESRQHDSKAG